MDTLVKKMRWVENRKTTHLNLKRSVKEKYLNRYTYRHKLRKTLVIYLGL